MIAQVALAIEKALAGRNAIVARRHPPFSAARADDRRCVAELTAGLGIKNVLQIAADELQRSINSRRAVVRLTIPTAEGTE